MPCSGVRGFYRGSSILLSGTAGTGKSSFSATIAAAACARGEPSARSELILVVDDDPDVRNLVSDFVSLLGYRAKTADSAAAALDILFGSDGIDLLVSDVVMPGMNGFQLAERARRAKPDLPVLLMSGYADHARMDTGSLVVSLIEKPFQLDDIEPLLSQLLRDRPS